KHRQTRFDFLDKQLLELVGNVLSIGGYYRPMSAAKTMFNHTMQRMQASRLARSQPGSPWRLARTADGDRWT
ncbi:MAG: hypothetical protein WCK27_31730, partial [Verrucomicrobiota bacterium]